MHIYIHIYKSYNCITTIIWCIYTWHGIEKATPDFIRALAMQSIGKNINNSNTKSTSNTNIDSYTINDISHSNNTTNHTMYNSNRASFRPWCGALRAHLPLGPRLRRLSSSAVFWYMDMYIYIHTHVYIYIYTYMHIYIYKHICMYVYIYIYIYIYLFFRGGFSPVFLFRGSSSAVLLLLRLLILYYI